MAAITKRHFSRRFAMQGLYQWLMTGYDINRIEANMLTSKEMRKKLKSTDVEYFKHLLHDIPKHIDVLDELIKPKLDRPIEELDLIELIILRIGVFELMQNQVPRKVVINEAIEITKRFGGTDGHKYVNGILDKI